MQEKFKGVKNLYPNENYKTEFKAKFEETLYNESSYEFKNFIDTYIKQKDYKKENLNLVETLLKTAKS